MAVRHFLDARKAIAKWGHDMFEWWEREDPPIPIENFIDTALVLRLKVIGPKRMNPHIITEGRSRVIDIFSLCYLVAEAEILSRFTFEERMYGITDGKDISQKIHDVIDHELIRSGHKKLPDLIHIKLSHARVDPAMAELLYGNDPDFRAIMERKRDWAAEHNGSKLV